VHEIATSPRPADHYAALRERGVHRSGDAWLVARPADVAAALDSPALTVAPATAPVGDAACLQARMARFSDGADHARRRSAIQAVIPDSSDLEDAAACATQSRAARETAKTIDAMPLARTVPAAVLSVALGVAPMDADRVARATGHLCERLGLRSGPEVDAAARELLALLEPLAPADDEQVVAALSVLFQARDATAALIGRALLVGAGGGADAAQWVDRALRQDPPVQCTRRTAVADVELGGVTVPAGATVWILLAAAEVGPPDPPATFGSGTHACPAAPLATALARGVVAGLLADGLRPVPGQQVSYEPRANLRLPATVLMERG
jgi:cytochrome P450